MGRHGNVDGADAAGDSRVAARSVLTAAPLEVRLDVLGPSKSGLGNSPGHLDGGTGPDEWKEEPSPPTPSGTSPPPPGS